MDIAVLSAKVPRRSRQELRMASTKLRLTVPDNLQSVLEKECCYAARNVVPCH